MLNQFYLKFAGKTSTLSIGSDDISKNSSFFLFRTKRAANVVTKACTAAASPAVPQNHRCSITQFTIHGRVKYPITRTVYVRQKAEKYIYS